MPGLSVKLPLAFSPTDGPYQLIKNFSNLAHQNFKNLVLTNPGEKVMDPDFGVGIRRLLFEQKSPELYDTISSRLSEQVEVYLPYIQINGINFVEPEESMSNIGVVSVEISYSVATLSETNVLSINL
jgi:phage baseplate assembly protein W